MISVRAWLGTFGSSGLVLLIGVATGILTARLLLPEGRGAVAAVLLLPQIIGMVAFLSIEIAVIRELGEVPGRIRQLLPTGMVIVLVLSLLAAGAGYALAPVLLGSDREDLVELTRQYMAVHTPFLFVSQLLFSIDQAQHRFRRYNTLRLLPPAIYLFSLSALWLLGKLSVATTIWAQALSVAIVCVARLWLSRWDLRLTFDRGIARRLLAWGMRFHAAAVISLLARHGDRILVIVTSGNARVGIYAAALTLASSGLNLIGGSLSVVVLPTISAEADEGLRIRYLERGLQIATPIALLAGSTLAALAPILVPLFFGEEFDEAVRVTQVLSLAYVTVALRHLMVNALRGLSQPRPGTIAELLALVVLAAVGWPAGIHYGLIGLAVAIALSGIAAYAFLIVHIHRCLGPKVGDLIGLRPSAVANSLRYVFTALREPGKAGRVSQDRK